MNSIGFFLQTQDYIKHRFQRAEATFKKALKTIKLLLILLFALVTSSCHAPDDCDKKLYNCWIKSYKDLGIDLKNMTIDLENKLIKLGYLKDSSYQSYIDFLCNYSDSNIYIPNLNELKSINSLNQKEYLCDDLCKKTAKEFSIFVNDYFKISNSEINRLELTNCINEQKFNSNPIYKTWILLNLYLKIQSTIQFSNFLKEIVRPKDIPNITDTLSLKNGKFFLNGKKCPLQTLRDKTNGKKAIILKASGEMTVEQLTD